MNLFARNTFQYFNDNNVIGDWILHPMLWNKKGAYFEIWIQKDKSTALKIWIFNSSKTIYLINYNGNVLMKIKHVECKTLSDFPKSPCICSLIERIKEK